MKNKRTICFGLVLATFSNLSNTLADTFGIGDNQFTVEFVEIGNPGNAGDTRGFPGDLVYGAGTVDYDYRIGKYEVSRDMIAKSNSDGNLGITLHPLDFVTRGPRANMPATGVAWNEAARFVNWLNTSNGYSPAYRFLTQPGEEAYSALEQIKLWEPGDAGYDAENRFRNSQAFYFLPNIDEWHKAAFFDPDANFGAGGYWDYPYGSDSTPAPIASGTAPGTAVWNHSASQGPADITLAGGMSFYGVVGMAGNAEEWEETSYFLTNDINGLDRGVRGGHWALHTAYLMSALARGAAAPESDVGGDTLGFRVASQAVVPEPNSALLGLLGAMILWLERR